MKLIQTRIPDVVMIEPTVFEDDRGWFMESFHERRFHEGLKNIGLPVPGSFVQDNHSRSIKGVLRGLHYQVKCPQGKLTRVSLGEVFDVAVDLRTGSPTFGHWVGVFLSADNKRQLWIPPGFAHGFFVLSEAAECQYKCTDYYAAQDERSLKWDDPAVAIDWPIPFGFAPHLSIKDRGANSLSEVTPIRKLPQNLVYNH